MKPGEPKGPVQRIASGLLGFFQLKNQGNPTVINDDLQPTIELLNWYLRSACTVVPATSNVTIVANTIGFVDYTGNRLVVPQDEWWYVERYTITAACTLATDQIRFAPAIASQVTGTSLLLAPMEDQFITANIPNVQTAMATGFWVPPGQAIGLYSAFAETLTSITATGNIEYVAIPI
jgi:hypothetical protein